MPYSKFTYQRVRNELGIHNERVYLFPYLVPVACVTTGTEWQFLKLESKTCFIDRNRYYIDKLENILGALQAIVDFYELTD